MADPTLGVLGMQDELRDLGLNYNVKRIRRLLQKMGVEPIYPKRNLSHLPWAGSVHSSLFAEALRDYSSESGLDHRYHYSVFKF